MLKRLFDFIISATALLVLMPVLAILGLLVFFNVGKPILFRQRRPGLNGVPFEMLKFRTMLDANDSAGKPLDDSVRLTKLGRFLRSSSLDELPGLWNVVLGDMSLVGPRPLLVEYLPLYTPKQKRRHDVRPGITGWTQVNGRNALSWDEKFELDVWYVDHANLWLDVKILCLTVFKVFSRRGISADGYDTMPDFYGTPPDQNKTEHTK